MKLGKGDGMGCERGALWISRDVDPVFACVFCNDEPRASAELEPFALTNGVEPIAGVSTEFFACFPLDDVAAAGSYVVAKEVVVRGVAKEAYALTVGSVGGGEMMGCCEGSDLVFEHVANWEMEASELGGGYLAEEVGLIFDGIDGCCEVFLPIENSGGCVVTSYGLVEVLAYSIVEASELDEAVAHDVGIGCKSVADAGNQIVDNSLPIVVVQVYRFYLQSQLPPQQADNFEVFFHRAAEGFFFVGAYDDVEKGGLESLFDGEEGCYGTVYST